MASKTIGLGPVLILNSNEISKATILEKGTVYTIIIDDTQILILFSDIKNIKKSSPEINSTYAVVLIIAKGKEKMLHTNIDRCIPNVEGIIDRHMNYVNISTNHAILIGYNKEIGVTLQIHKKSK